MQLPAAQTSLEPQPRRVDQQGRKPFVSQNAPSDDGSRLTSEPYRSNARASCTQAPAVESNKLPTMRGEKSTSAGCYALACQRCRFEQLGCDLNGLAVDTLEDRVQHIGLIWHRPDDEPEADVVRGDLAYPCQCTFAGGNPSGIPYSYSPA